MNEFSTFKTALVGGFDKDDVMVQLKNIKDESEKEKEQIKKQIVEKDAYIKELQEKLRHKEDEVIALKEDIKDKYKKYEENYNSISKLVFDAQIKADKMKQEAQEQCEQMLDNAREEAHKLLGDVEKEVDMKLADGKKKYKEVQGEIGEIARLMNQVQNKFMASYRDINEILEGMPQDFNEVEVSEEYPHPGEFDDFGFDASEFSPSEYGPSDLDVAEELGFDEIAVSDEFDDFSEFDALDEAQKEIELQLQQFLADEE